MTPPEPPHETPDHLRSVLEELRDREPIFHRREFGTSREDFLAQTDDQFWEIGASGRRYSRDYVAETRAASLLSEPEPWDSAGWLADDFYCQELANDLYLLTYTLAQGDRITRRATIWRREHDRWLIVYHQGTVVVDE